MKFDIKTAFLYGELKEEIYMHPPEGFETGNKICKLQKALYGLKQAPQKWNRKFIEILRKQSLIQLKTEKCIFKTEQSSIILAIYIDDGILIGKNPQEMKKLLSELKKDFEITTEENPKIFLGIKFEKTKGSIKLTREDYARQILETYSMQNSKSTDTLITPDREY